MSQTKKNIDWDDLILGALADANRKIGETRKEKCFIDYADALDNSRILRQAEKLIKEE